MEAFLFKHDYPILTYSPKIQSVPALNQSDVCGLVKFASA